MTLIPTGMRPTRWRGIVAIWLAGGLLDACQTVLVTIVEGVHHASLPAVFGTELLGWLPWVLATPMVIRLARRYPLTRGISLRMVSAHLAAFVVISVVAEVWSTALQLLCNPYHLRGPTFFHTWSVTLAFQILTFLIAYALIVAVTLVVDARESMARQIAEAARLNEELSRAQLAALRRQIEPHFMYNALNSIAGLVRDQRNDAAVSMIVGLSEFLRRAAADSHRAQVALQEEVEYLQRYVDIQKVRFGERLKVDVQIPAELLGALVPNLLLQPLVENAIKHGISKRVAGGTVRVIGERQGGRLSLSIYNDGSPLAVDWEKTQTGVGLRNLRTRLQILHGNESGLQLQSVAPGGVEVIVTLPFREA